MVEAIVGTDQHEDYIQAVTLRIRRGEAADVDAAVALYERSSLARRRGVWGDDDRAAQVERTRRHLLDAAAWFFLAHDGPVLVGMASAEPLRQQDGAGPVIRTGCFLNSVYVAPERWGEGIGGALLDAVIAEARLRRMTRVQTWTHEDNERAQRLYRSRAFAPTGRTAGGQAEWARI
jgi:GNAT superfamily N-acetyltransferase